MHRFTTAVELAGAIRTKEVSPSEVLDECLKRVDRLDPQLNAIVWRNDDEARAAAKVADDAVVAGDDLAPFHGVPLPIKDLTPAAGMPATYGSYGAPEGQAAEDALVVAAFRNAGFLLTGRTNTPEFGPITITENVRYGVTRNPWNPEFSPGGSSGGAGAAVSSGMFPVAHANDGGGSIRIPASCCGLVGLKVSRGRVPAAYQSWEGASVEGVLTRTVADTAAILDVVSYVDDGSWYNAPSPERPFAQEVGADVRRLRIGVVRDASLDLPVAPECVAAVEATARLLEGLGHDIVDGPGELLPLEAVAAFSNVVSSGLAGYEGIDWTRTEPHVQRSYRAAQAVDSLTYVRSVHTLQRATRDIVSAWGRDFDLLLTPTMSIPPPPAGQVLQEVHASEGVAMTVLQMVIFTAAFNITGQPAISLPVHESRGLPIGVQLVGRPWGEAELVRVASQLEGEVRWYERVPSL